MKISALTAVATVGGTDKLIVETVEGTKTAPLTVLDTHTLEQVQPKLDTLKQELEKEIGTQVAGAFVAKGSCAFSDLADKLSEGNVGDVYNVTDSFNTDESFVEGAGHHYEAGTNVVLVDNDGHKWDAMAATVDLTNYVTKSELRALETTVTAVSNKADTNESNITSLTSQVSTIQEAVQKNTAALTGLDGTVKEQLDTIKQTAESARTAADKATTALDGIIDAEDGKTVKTLIDEAKQAATEASNAVSGLESRVDNDFLEVTHAPVV